MKKSIKTISTLRLLSIFVGILILIAPLSSAFAGPKAPRVKVMTRNLYLGADIFKVATALPENVTDAVADVYNTMLYTNFWARAEAIADEIMYNDPEVVGLQEVSTFYKQTPGDFLMGNPVQASTVVIDFYTVLNTALEARGLFYTAYITTNSDVEVPMTDFSAGSPYYSDVRMVDNDVLLVKANYDSSQVLLTTPYDTNNYQNNLAIDIAGTLVTFTRGFVIVNADIKGTEFRVVSTHLEVRSAEGSVFRVFQAAQMQELTGILSLLATYDAEPVPVIMLGDFNSSHEDVPGVYDPRGANISYVPPYMQAVAGGYLDTWLLQANPNKPIYDDGYTSGFDEYIDNPLDTLETRIDHVFLDKGNLELKKSRSEIVGNESTDMVPIGPAEDPEYMLWPSDHAGVVSRLMFF